MLSLFYSLGYRGTEKLRNLPKVTELEINHYLKFYLEHGEPFQFANRYSFQLQEMIYLIYFSLFSLLCYLFFLWNDYFSKVRDLLFDPHMYYLFICVLILSFPLHLKRVFHI